MKRALLLWGAVPALLVAWTVVPLATGARTLYLRDILNTHLVLRAYLGEALRAGELPLVDPLRAGGQPLAGNPNAVALYPDNLLLLAGSTLWQLNAHFWLHWLVAAAGVAALARRRGLGRESALAAGVAFAFSGYWLSQMNLYNAVAPVALAPWLAVAALAARAEPRAGRGTAGLALATGLALLGGDPILAVLGLLFALTLALGERGDPAGGRRAPARLALGVGLGALVALPQIVETLRILPASFRGFWGYEAAHQASSGPEGRLGFDLLIPLFLGRPDLGVDWAAAAGAPPRLYFAIAPGLAFLALAAFGARRRARGDLPLALLAGAGLVCAFGWRLFVALGVASLPGGELFRFPVKFLLWPALALALWAGAGIERLLAGERVRRLTLGLAALAAVEVALWLFFTTPPRPLAAGFVAALGAPLDAARFDAERVRWAGICLIQALALAGSVLALRFLRPARAAPVLLAVAALGQWILLRPLLATDEAAAYQRRPALLDRLPADAVLCHGNFRDLFGGGFAQGLRPPDGRLFWAFRRAHEELYSFSGLLAGRRYELNFSPEGLDTFVVQSLGLGLTHFSDPERLAVLRATGVDLLLLQRPLAAAAAARARVLSAPAADEIGGSYVYQLEGALGEAQLLGEVVRAPSVDAAVRLVRRPEFEPTRVAVVAGAGPPSAAPAGVARIVESGPERVVVEAASERGGVLVLRRAHLPIWRVEVDGEPAPTLIAQLTRLGVELGPGTHRVLFRVDRRPLAVALTVSTLALALAAALALRRVHPPGGALPGC